jgi:hypothetical protein
MGQHGRGDGADLSAIRRNEGSGYVILTVFADAARRDQAIRAPGTAGTDTAHVRLLHVPLLLVCCQWLDDNSKLQSTARGLIAAVFGSWRPDAWRVDSARKPRRST